MKLKNALMIWGPLVAGAGLIVYLQLKKKKKMDEGEDVPPGHDLKVAVQAVVPVASLFFPLRKGSNNEKVKELQGLLGITADGAFGPVTETALVNFASIRTVDSQAQLDQLKKQAAGVTNVLRAKDLVTRFLKGGQNIYVINDAKMLQVIEDSYGAVIGTGKQIIIPGGKVLNNIDYTLTKWTKGGNILMNVTRGALLGTYETNPNDITLKPV